MSSVSPIPPGMTAVTPHLVCRNANEAMEFYKRAFGAVEYARLPGPDGKLMHGLLAIGGACIMLVDEFPGQGTTSPQSLGGSPVCLHLYVPDADATFARAISAGAQPVMPVADMFWGDRYGRLTDPYGHQWSVATHVRDLTPEQIAAAMPSPGGCPEGAKP